MKELVEQIADRELTPEERNLLSVAYKNVVGTRRSAWRVVSSLLEKSMKDSAVAEEYKIVIENELKEICNEVIVSHKFVRCWLIV